jgi:hypothetical protein
VSQEKVLQWYIPLICSYEVSTHFVPVNLRPRCQHHKHFSLVAHQHQPQLTTPHLYTATLHPTAHNSKHHPRSTNTVPNSPPNPSKPINTAYIPQNSQTWSYVARLPLRDRLLEVACLFIAHTTQLGRVAHYAFDAVLCTPTRSLIGCGMKAHTTTVSAFLAGVRRSTGLTYVSTRAYIPPYTPTHPLSSHAYNLRTFSQPSCPPATPHPPIPKPR